MILGKASPGMSLFSFLHVFLVVPNLHQCRNGKDGHPDVHLGSMIG